MPEIQTAAQCDNCHKSTIDYMKDGWITIQGEIVKYSGRDKSGYAKSEIFWQSPGVWHDSFRFLCSIKCFAGRRVKK